MKLQLVPVAMFFVACAAFAEIRPTFEEVDVNADGVLSQQEVTSTLAGIDFKKADLDGNGALNKQEYEYAKAVEKQDRGKDTGVSG